MISEKQLAANRANALKSTGPRTEAGMAIASKNAIKHGLLSQDAVIDGEDFEEFAHFRQQLIDDLVPVGQLECLLANRIISSFWKLRRSGRIENGLFDVLLNERDDAVTSSGSPLLRIMITKTHEYSDGQTSEREVVEDSLNKIVSDDDSASDPRGTEDSNASKDEPAPADRMSLGKVLHRDLTGSNVLLRFCRYESQIERSLFRSLNELQKMQYLRKRNEAILYDQSEI